MSRKILSFFFPQRVHTKTSIEQILDGSVPEDAAIINGTGSIHGGAVADCGCGHSETGDAVSVGEVVPALEHCIDRIRSGG